MRFMLIRRADKITETGVLPSAEVFAAMAQYNADMAKAGAFLQGEGLKPSSMGARVKINGAKPVVTDGPFAETKELIAGFTMIRANSLEEAIEWVKRWPAIDAGAEIEIRPVYEMGDFAGLLSLPGEES